MQNVKVMFGCNGEVVRYVRDLLLMVWEDLPVKMPYTSSSWVEGDRE